MTLANFDVPGAFTSENDAFLERANDTSPCNQMKICRRMQLSISSEDLLEKCDHLLIRNLISDFAARDPDNLMEVEYHTCDAWDECFHWLLLKLIQRDDVVILSSFLRRATPDQMALLPDCSTWALPMAARLSSSTFECLVNFGMSVPAALNVAVETENLIDIVLLVRRLRTTGSRDYINEPYDEMTPLMVAAWHGSELIAKHLIDNGANPEIRTDLGDALVAARVRGRVNIEQLLRAATNQVPRNDLQKSSFANLPLSCLLRDDVQRLDKPSRPRWRDRDNLNKFRIRFLRRQFRKQHSIISSRALASIPWNIPLWALLSGYEEMFSSGSWGEVINQDCSQAWDDGFRVMQRLSKGILPSSLNDVIMFLAIARAMCECSPTSSFSDLQWQFMTDLGRWQVLFEPDSEALRAFRNAVCAVWGATSEDLDQTHALDSTCLHHFQELAICLVHKVDSYFDLGSETDLPSAQIRCPTRETASAANSSHYDVLPALSAPDVSVGRGSKTFNYELFNRVGIDQSNDSHFHYKDDI